MKYLDAKALASQAEGNWPLIMQRLAPEVYEAYQRGPRHKVDCPFPHGGKKDFRVFKDFELNGGGICTCGARPNGFLVLQDRNSWDFRRALEEVDLVLNGYCDKVVPLKPKKVIPKEPLVPPEEIKKRLASTVSKSVPARDPRAAIGWTYYFSRGISPSNTMLADMRFAPAVGYYDDDFKKVSEHPTWLGIVRNRDGTAVSLHRTYLTNNCASKADVELPKKLCSFWKEPDGAAIRLGPVEECIGIAEGIETALAVGCATGQSCWASISASIMQNFVPPEGVKRVIIWADKDRSQAGEKAALILKKRLWDIGVPAMIMLPKGEIPEGAKSIDWLDVVASKSEAMPILSIREDDAA